METHVSPELQAVYDEVAKCGKCGFCQAVCPIFDITKDEGSVARGHNLHIRKLIEGELTLNAELKDPLFECLLCMTCVSNCFPAVRTHENVVQGRAEYIKRVGRPKTLQFLFNNLLPDPKKMARFMRMGAYGKKLGVSKLARTLGVLKWFGNNLDKAEVIVEKLPTRFFRDRVSKLKLTPEHRTVRIGYFVGCGFNFVMPQVSEATTQLLVHLGAEVSITENCCCGLPAYTYGDLEAARKMARQNIAIIEKTDADFIVTECATCASFLKHYTKLFKDDPEMAQRAEQAAKRIRGFSEFIHSRLPLPDPRNTGPLTVTYHDPCHQCRYQGIVKEPRTILKQIPDIEYTEMPQADLCCGAAGSYNVMRYDQSMKILDRKMTSLKKTGAQILTNECPSCCLQLSYGVRRAGLETRVMHISELMRTIYLPDN